MWMVAVVLISDLLFSHSFPYKFQQLSGSGATLFLLLLLKHNAGHGSLICQERCLVFMQSSLVSLYQRGEKGEHSQLSITTGSGQR